MKRFTSLIIDDERLARVSLRKKLANIPEIDIVGEASGISSAIKAINDLRPEILFLDIQLSDGSGFDLLDKVNFTGKIVFVTAFDQHAVRAFEVNATDYLLKPVSVTRLRNLIVKLGSESNAGSYSSPHSFSYQDRIMIEQKGSVHFLLIQDIILITSANDYTIIDSTENRRHIILSSMNDWEQKLPKEHFFRAHRTYIINLNLIERTIRVGATAEVYLKGQPEPVRISRGYYKILRDRYFYK